MVIAVQLPAAADPRTRGPLSFALCVKMPIGVELLETEYGRLGVSFAEALSVEDFEGAYSMLSSSLQTQCSLQDMICEYRTMIEYGEGPVLEVAPEEGYADYPQKPPEDLGGVYVSLRGHGYLEGILVFVCRELGACRIREIQWRRP